jgi:hypothetical protein
VGSTRLFIRAVVLTAAVLEVVDSLVVPHHNRIPSPTSSPPVGGLSTASNFLLISLTPTAPAHGLFRTITAHYAQVLLLTFRKFVRDVSIPSSGHYLIRGQARDHSSRAALL